MRVDSISDEYKVDEFIDVSDNYYNEMQGNSAFFQQSTEYLLSENRLIRLLEEYPNVESVKKIVSIVDKKVALDFAKSEYKNLSIFRRILDVALKLLFGTDGTLKSQERALISFEKRVIKKVDPASTFGLPNVGNSCWMNATLQMLRSLPIVHEIGDDSGGIKQLIGRVYELALNTPQLNFLDEIKNLFVYTELDHACVDLMQRLGREIGLHPFHQHCPGELITSIARDIGLSPIRSKSVIELDQKNAESKNDNDGVECENFLLMVSLAGSLQDSILNYFEPEVLEGYNRGPASKKTALTEVPEDLFIQLADRVTHDPFEGNLIKSHNSIRLDDILVLMEGENSVEYQLQDVIVHRGSNANTGHYVTYKREERGWMLYNDNRVQGPYAYDQIRGDIETGSYLIRLTRISADNPQDEHKA
ncbi:MAG: ubiquitin carboxyl-terminal hydrolase family protein [Waddliaceae bacterium]